MGLFSFIKNAGAKVFGGKTNEEAAAELVESVKALGLNVEDLAISVDDDKATVSGEATDLATKEKVVLAVGNTEGIASVEDNLTVALSADQKLDLVAMAARFHVVEKGDTLSKISKEVYGDAMKYEVIFEANKPMLKSVDLIYPGQVLRIPPLD